jgi:hypothetical protein
VCEDGEKVDVVPPAALDSNSSIKNIYVNSDNGVCIVDEIPRESLALESSVNSILAHAIKSSKASIKDEDYEDVCEK